MKKSEWTLWPDEGRLVRGEVYIHLTPEETMLLECLAKKRGHVAPNWLVHEYIWGQRNEPEDPSNVVRVVTSRLNKKLLKTDLRVGNEWNRGHFLPVILPIAKYDDEAAACPHCGRPYDTPVDASPIEARTMQ